MAVLQQLSAQDLVLQLMLNDTEDAPWMVMGSLQVRDIDLLKSILLLHARRRQLPWVIESYLLITTPRPTGTSTLEGAPDLMVAVGDDRLRTSWSTVAEGKAPEFVLEVVTESSWKRDREDKPLMYVGMGVQEFALFYPERKDGGPPLFGYHRATDGSYVEWSMDAAGTLWSEVLGLGLYVEDELWLRARDRLMRTLPSPDELADLVEEAETGQQEAEQRAAAEAAARLEAEQRAAAEAAARQKAEAEVARLREELRRLREGRL